MDVLLPIALGIFLIICASFDLLYRRIPNWLTYPAALVAVLAHSLTGGMSGLAFSLVGLGVGMALLMPLYLVKGMGAGDVKLLGVVGACLGPKQVFYAFIGTSLAGGVYALILLAFHPHQLVTFVKNCFSGCVRLGKVLLHGRSEAAILLESNEKKPFEGTRLKVCYGVAIASGTIGSMLWERAGYPGLSGMILHLKGWLF